MFSALQRVKSTEDGPLGPGSDLLAALLGVFILLAISEKQGLGVRKFQNEIIEKIARDLQAESLNNKSDKLVKIYGGPKVGNDTIVVSNDGKFQHFYFGGNILFDQSKSSIKNNNAATILKTVGNSIHSYADYIGEIQIQGHADSTANDTTNLHLASKRAETVFWVFNNSCNIDPHKNLMSISSFGEYKPIQRDIGSWNSDLTNYYNRNPALMDKNRRIEIILFYKPKDNDGPKQ